MQAIDLVDESAAKLKMEITSKPTHLDEIDRKILQLEMERLSLAKVRHSDHTTVVGSSGIVWRLACSPLPSVGLSWGTADAPSMQWAKHAVPQPLLALGMYVEQEHTQVAPLSRTSKLACHDPALCERAGRPWVHLHIAVALP